MCCLPYRDPKNLSDELTYNEMKAIIGGMQYLIDIVKEDSDISWTSAEEMKDWVDFRQDIIKKLQKKVGA